LTSEQQAGKRLTALRQPVMCLSLFAIAVILSLTLSIRDKDFADRSREAQIALSRIELLVQDIHNLEWLATASREMTPEAEARLQSSKRNLLIANASLRLQSREAVPGQFNEGVRSFVQSTDRQLALIRGSRFEEARRLDFEEISQQLVILQQGLRQAGEAEARVASVAATRSQFELAVTALLVVVSVGFLFLRFRRQKLLLLAKQSVLQQSEERFRALTEKSTDIVFIIDPDGLIKYVSPSIEAVLAMHAEAVGGRHLREFVQDSDIPQVRRVLGVLEGQSEEIQLRFQHSDGRWLDFECVVRNLQKIANIGGLVVNVREITERKRAEEQLQFNASHDKLTGLPNRVFFLNRLQTVVDRIQRHPQETAAVLFVDVDDFKVVNDCFGHGTGDELIVEVGNRLKTCVRSDGSVARMGGDEFTILLEDVTNPSDAIRVGQRVHSVVAEPFQLLGHEVHKGVSIGIALTSHDSTAETLIQNADIAMYRAKSKGKGGTELFDTAMQEHVMAQLQLELRLRRALQNNELELHYQPIVTIATGRIEGFEALLRWNSCDSGSVSPGVFIPSAERSGLIVPISCWVMTTGCLEAASWQARFPLNQPLYVSINVSARHFAHPAFVGHVREALEKSAISPTSVKIELTESVAMNDAPGTEQTMSQLRVLGVKLSIDDFGTGYSSLSYLLRFPVDTLKVDQSFISAMQPGREGSSIVGTIVTLGQNLGLQVVAEGVETSDQLEMLSSMGCDAAQGYLFSKAVPSDSIKAVLGSHQRQAKHAVP
jgi:diguanylate cyclase (GGDEF)-like protein/PAS domain S-box-containing protein